MMETKKVSFVISAIEAESIALSLVEKIASIPKKKYSERVESMYIMAELASLPGKPFAIKDGEEFFKYSFYPWEAKVIKKHPQTLNTDN